MPNHRSKKQRRAKRRQDMKHERNGWATSCGGWRDSGCRRENTCSVCLGRSGRTKQRVTEHVLAVGVLDTKSNKEKRRDRRAWLGYRECWKRDCDTLYLHHSLLPSSC
jgi:hypothetical protein